jgi:hypothetical protein
MFGTRAQKKRDGGDVTANTISEFHNALMPYPSPPLIEIDLHVMKIEKNAVERMNGFKDCLLSREQQSSKIR